MREAIFSVLSVGDTRGLILVVGMGKCHSVSTSWWRKIAFRVV